MAMKTIKLITDGSCKPNPGKGGWACILRYEDHYKEIFGCEPNTTNNRMELLAVIKGLQAIKEPCIVEVTTDSKYVKNGITTWIKSWKAKQWRTSTGKPVLNQDLWETLDILVSKHQVNWAWTKGHASHPDNNQCDKLASAAASTQTGS